MYSIADVPKAASACPHNFSSLVESMAGQAGFGKEKRLLNANDYGRVFDSPDARASNKFMLLLSRRNSLDRHRLGLVIAKKNIRLAADRNRVKRLAREFVRQLPRQSPGLDVVVLARRGLGELDNAEVSSILQQLWQKLTRHHQNPGNNSSNLESNNRES